MSTYLKIPLILFKLQGNVEKVSVLFRICEIHKPRAPQKLFSKVTYAFENFVLQTDRWFSGIDSAKLLLYAYFFYNFQLNIVAY